MYNGIVRKMGPKPCAWFPYVILVVELTTRAMGLIFVYKCFCLSPRVQKVDLGYKTSQSRF